ncbi:MAG: Tad domain-containing protein [candidate division WOR-3 bacterium]|nr:MAG: Tad domain-containing protein [candidate division WOR-3 bacterium]
MLVTRLGRRLLRDTSGQVLLFGAILMVALLAFLMMIPNGTQVATQKMRAQTASDAGAYTGSVWLARSLNLSANMNIGLRSVHTWMTVLTMGSALSGALNTDSFDVSVRDLGADMAYALFNNYDPVVVSAYIYPASIESLYATEKWLQDLQDDVAVSFPLVGQEIAASEARRNASGGDPSSENPGAEVLIVTNTIDTLTGDTIPMLVEDSIGDKLMYDELFEVAASLESFPTMDENIGPAMGSISIDTATMDIAAYYGVESQWYNIKQGVHYYMDAIKQVFQDTTTGKIDSGYRFFAKFEIGHPPWFNYLTAVPYPQPRQAKDSWVSRFDNGKNILLRNPMPLDNAYKCDTVVMERHYFKKGMQPLDPWVWDNYQKGDSILPCSSGLGKYSPTWDSSWVYSDFYIGAESTDGHLGPKLRPRRVNPDREFHAVSYVWRLGANTSPRGPGPRYGGGLFRRSGVPAPMPMVTLARSVPYLAIDSPADEDFFFSPNWDTKLTALDATAVQDIAGGEAYSELGLDSLYLEELRNYVLLP